MLLFLRRPRAFHPELQLWKVYRGKEEDVAFCRTMLSLHDGEAPSTRMPCERKMHEMQQEACHHHVRSNVYSEKVARINGACQQLAREPRNRNP
ncbi:hypothetical protein HPB48_025229 [Haemaphysalis longicornis]|uniref:Uncharacterized protein n=1 Tax=Haemaphysalis longicornis TaxID=44386 RepID=A0A9J6HA20_HAELO|nr:hypothetical protein HPB48_025229 [Haemaphysalis longicornis]